MKYSKVFGKTIRQKPHEIKNESQALLIQGGYIRPLSNGLFSFLPLGQRVINKLVAIIREEMSALDGQEVQVPIVNPYRLWWKGGRTDLIKEDLVSFKDREGRMMVLSPSHEEAMVQLVKDSLKSYRDFPILLYQFQTKFRDEQRTKAGLMRAREFTMKDAYSFHSTRSDLNNFFPKVFNAYTRLFRRCGLDTRAVEAGVGYMGGEKAYEFMVPAENGDDTIVYCESCGYAANLEVAQGIKETLSEKPLPVQSVDTDGCTTMRRLSKHLSLKTSRLAKSMVYKTRTGYVMGVVRGDFEISIEKLTRAAKQQVLRLASAAELARLGLLSGYLSPVGNPPIPVVIDDAVVASSNLVFGANEAGRHLLNVNHGRDYESPCTADIALVRPENDCRICHGPLQREQALELGHIFKLGEFYCRSLDLFVRGEDGAKSYPSMGSYGIGIGRLLAAVVERHHDDRGISWPPQLAPYRVYLMGIGKSLAVKRVTDELCESLGDEVLLDDRSESPGVKFKDADLLGIPIRIVVSARHLGEGTVEIYERRSGTTWAVPLEDVASTLNRLEKESEDQWSLN